MAETDTTPNSPSLTPQLTHIVSTRAYDANFLDTDYASVRWGENLQESLGHLFVYHSTYSVTYPRKLGYPKLEAKKAAFLAKLPSKMSCKDAFSTSFGQVLPSTIILEPSTTVAEYSSSQPSARAARPKRLHWRVCFGPSECQFNGEGVVSERYYVPGSARFGQVYATIKALEKVYEILSFAKSKKRVRSNLGGGRRKHLELGQAVVNGLLNLETVVVFVRDAVLMEWLCEKSTQRENWEIVQMLAPGEFSKSSERGKKALLLVRLIKEMIQTVEAETGVEIKFWGIYDAAAQVLEDPGDITLESSSRSPTPDMPVMSDIRIKFNAPEIINLDDNPPLTPDDYLSENAINCRTTRDYLKRRPLYAPDIKHPFYGMENYKAAGLRSPSEAVKYILKKYLPPAPDNDKAWNTDDDILRQQSQITVETQRAQNQKRKRDDGGNPQTPKRSTKNYKSVIVDVPIGPDGKELPRNGRWKGPKMRKVVKVEIPTSQGPKDGITEVSNSLFPNEPSMPISTAQAIETSERSSPTESELATPAPLPLSAMNPLINSPKDTTYDSSDTVVEESMEAIAAKPPKTPRRRACLKPQRSAVEKTRIQPSRGKTVLASPLPKMYTWDAVTSSPVKPA